MDAFKILSRSTNLTRKRSTPAPTPSNGQARTPQLFGTAKETKEPSVDEDHTDGASKKRKRGQGTKLEDTVLPEALDFFSRGRNGISATVDGSGSDRGRSNDRAADSDSPGDGAEAPSPEPDLPEEECRRILRSHKLKITRLDEPPQAAGPADAKELKKRRRDTIAAAEADELKKKKKKKHRLDVIPQPLRSFSQLRSRYGVDARLAANVQEQGFRLPTEVQLAALPLLLDAGRRGKEDIGVDLLAIAPTGSGKTLAFLIPVLDAIIRRKKNGHAGRAGPEAVVVAPTKELANQIVGEAKKLAKGTGLDVALARKSMRFGSSGPRALSAEGESDSDDMADYAGQSLPDIIVTTPLTLVRVLSLADGSTISIPTVQHLVLDEADVLLDALFRKQTLAIWSACSSPSLRLTCWSATMGASVEDIVRSTIDSRLSNSPPTNGHSSSTRNFKPMARTPLLRLVVGLKDSAIPHIAHKLLYCGSESGKLLALRQLLRPNSDPSTSTSSSPCTTLRPPFLVFTQSIPRARALASELLYDIPASAGGSSRISVLHAALTSSQRRHVMDATRRGEVWVLITTDLLSRGVDFRGINGVVNYDLPTSAAGYVHRVGRTGRAGREGGVAVTLYEKEDLKWVRGVVNVIAASERAKGEGGSAPGAEGLDQWLLDSLPKVGKRDRQMLKKRGVEERRPDWLEKGGEKGRKGKKGMAKRKISTKSGWERRKEDRKRGAVEGSKRRKREEEGGESEFEGFE